MTKRPPVLEVRSMTRSDRRWIPASEEKITL